MMVRFEWKLAIVSILAIGLLSVGCSDSQSIDLDAGAGLGMSNGRPCFEKDGIHEWGPPELERWIKARQEMRWFEVDPSSVAEVTDDFGYTHSVSGAPVATSGPDGKASGTVDIMLDATVTTFPIGLDHDETLLVAAQTNDSDPKGRLQERSTLVGTSPTSWTPLVTCGSPLPGALLEIANDYGFVGADADRWILGLISSELPGAIEVPDRERILSSLAPTPDSTDTHQSPEWADLAPSERSLLDATGEVAEQIESVIVEFDIAGLRPQSDICVRTATALGACIYGEEILNAPEGIPPPFPADRLGSETIEILLDGEVIGRIPGEISNGAIVQFSQPDPPTPAVVTVLDS